MHTRESEQKTKWLDQNPTKNRNNIFKIKNEILHAHYICFVVVLMEGRGKGRRQGRDGKEKERRGSQGGQREEKERKRKEAKEKLGGTEPYSRVPLPAKDLSGPKHSSALCGWW